MYRLLLARTVKKDYTFEERFFKGVALGLILLLLTPEVPSPGDTTTSTPSLTRLVVKEGLRLLRCLLLLLSKIEPLNYVHVVLNGDISLLIGCLKLGGSGL